MINVGDIGIGSIIIPNDVSRDAYIQRCYDLGECAIYVNEVGLITRVKMGMSVMNHIVFPQLPGEYGSMVVYMKTPNYRNYVIFDVIKDANKSNITRENTFSMIRNNGDDGVSIIGDPKSGSLMINIDKEGGGVVSITAGKPGSIMSVKIGGTADIEVDDAVITAYKSFSVKIPNNGSETPGIIEYNKEVGFHYLDEFDNEIFINKENVKILSSKINFGNGEEHMVLGDKLKSLLDDFIAAVSNITTTTALGVQPIMNKAVVESLKQRTEAILSDLTYTD